MQPADIYVQLRRLLNATDAPIVLAAVSSDPLVWKALQEPEFLQNALSEECVIASAWSPANLALRPFSSQISFAELTAEHIPGIEVSLRKKALELLETTLRNPAPVQSLEQAGLLALALRERRRKMQSWRGFLGELLSVPAGSADRYFELWQTPLACLYGMIPDKWDFLESLLPQNAMHPAVDWISHIILSNPLDQSTQVTLFHDLMNHLAVEYQVEWLKILSGKGHFSLVSGIADKLLNSDREFFDTLEEAFVPDQAEWVVTSRKILDTQLAATLNQMADRPLQAGIYLEKTRTYLHHWFLGSTIQHASLGGTSVNNESNLSAECAGLMAMAPVNEGLQTEAIFTNPAGTINSRMMELPAIKESLAGQMMVDSFAGGSPDHQQKSRKAITDWLRETKNNPGAIRGQFVYNWNPMVQIRQLEARGLLPEAVQIAERFLTNRAGDVELLTWLADAAHKLGDDEKSINTRLQVILRQPEETEHVRKLAETWEDRQDWASALNERRNVIRMTGEQSVNDQLAYASCGINAKVLDEAVSTCQTILANDPENGMAYSLLGKAALVQGDLDTSIDHLRRATVLVPEESMPWFELAEAYRRKGDTATMLDTLREAVLTAPDSSELHYSLGKAYMDNNQASEALPFLRQSARLAPDSVQIALDLSDALTNLGYKQEALDVVEAARVRWRVHDELAFRHARILVKDGKTTDGLAVLEIALQSENPRADWYVLYAKTLVGDPQTYLTEESDAANPEDLDKALLALKKATALQPQHFEAQLLTAETYLLRKDYESAFGTYSKLMEQPNAVQEEWYWRVQAGPGRVSLNLGQTETALASLQNAVSACPESSGLNRLLAETFTRAALHESAAEAADRALSLQAEDVATLTWYANLMSRIGQLDKAVQAMNNAVNLQPENLDLRITLAQTLLTQGDRETSLKELGQIVENQTVSVDQLRAAAKIYIGLDNPADAIASLEKGVGISGGSDASLLYDLARINQSVGKFDQALEWSQKAIQCNPKVAEYHVLQSDVYDQLNHSQAAILSLENALKAVEEGQSHTVAAEPSSRDVTDDALIVGIHQRFARRLKMVGSLSEALDHAEKTVELSPLNTEFRFLASDLANKLLQYDRALALLTSGSLDTGSDEMDPWTSGLLALEAELAIEDHDFAKAGAKIKASLSRDTDCLRLRIAELRLLLADGQYTEADASFADLWSQLNPSFKNQPKILRNSAATEQPDMDDSACIALSDAAIAMHRWSEASQLMDAVIKHHPTQPLALLHQARAQVRAAEAYLTGMPLGCQTHLPDESVIGENASTRFFQNITELQKTNQSPEIDRWRIRGEAVFHPSAASIRGFANLNMSGEDAAALVLVLNRTGNAEGATQVASEFNQHSEVMLQMAAVDTLGNPELNQQYAQKAVDLNPRNPIAQIALARTSEKAGDSGRALEAVETALVDWPEEAGWQHWAAETALKLNELSAALDHLEKTFALMPADLNVALELGRVYQRLEKYPEAVKVLGSAVQIAPNNSEAWLELGQALYANKQYPEALSAASQAAQQADENNYKALVLSGEILLATGDDRKAMDYARDAEKIAPSAPEIRLLTARILIARGKEKDALATLTKAIADIPGILPLESEHARLVYKLQGAESAVRVLQPLAQQNPENDQVISLYAAALAECGRAAEAEKAASLALRLNPEKAEIHLLLGRLYADAGQLDKSVHHLSESARLSPNQTDAYLDLGKVFTTRRDFSEALAAYQQAMRTAPEDHRAFYLAGVILRDGKDYAAAEAMLRRAAALAPSDVNIRRQLGAIVALNLVHNCQEANTCL